MPARATGPAPEDDRGGPRYSDDDVAAARAPGHGVARLVTSATAVTPAWRAFKSTCRLRITLTVPNTPAHRMFPRLRLPGEPGGERPLRAPLWHAVLHPQFQRAYVRSWGWWPMRSVLIVEDDADLRETLTELLTPSGRSVFAAATGADALRLLNGTDVPRPCLILLDWRMQPMAGQEFLSSIHARADVAELSVVIVSGDPAAPTTDVAPEVVATLSKPFDIATLDSLLKTYG